MCTQTQFLTRGQSDTMKTASHIANYLTYEIKRLKTALDTPGGVEKEDKDEVVVIVKTLEKLIEWIGPTDESKDEVYALILNERDRQDKEHKIDFNNDYAWLAIVMEELGEAAKEVLEGGSAFRFDELKEEIIHVSASSFAWLEQLADMGE